MLFLDERKSASGYYGIATTIDTSGSGGDTTWVYSPEQVLLATTQISANAANSNDKWFTLSTGQPISVFAIEELLGIQWALCSFSGTSYEGTTINNEFCYILASRINLNKISTYLPYDTMSVTGGSSPTDAVSISELSGSEHLGQAWIADEETWLMDTTQVLLNSMDAIRDSNKSMICSNIKKCYTKILGKNSIVSVMMNATNTAPIIRYIGNKDKVDAKSDDVAYMVVTYNGTYMYVKKNKFSHGRVPILQTYEQAVKNNAISNACISTETVNLEEAVCLMNSTQVKSYAGSYTANKMTGNFEKLKTSDGTVKAVGHETINDTKFLIVYESKTNLYYIPYDSIEEDYSNASPLNSTLNYHTIGSEEPYVAEEVQTIEWQHPYRQSSTGSTEKIRAITEIDMTMVGGRRNGNYDWYNTTLEAGKYPNAEMNDITGAKFLPQDPDTLTPPGWSDTNSLSDVDHYSLHRYTPKFINPANGGHIDTRQITKMNRFRFMDDMGGLSTKSFIFMTKPDLNILKLDENGYGISGSMNPDLKRIPEFKYIGRNKDVGYHIIDSLEYWGTNSGNTPWLSIITNQAEGYTPIDREIAYTEVGETFHGHKVLYGKHDFKHNIAGTVEIPFSERRDLSLYYTLKLWTEYIHCINLGLVSPRPVHIKNAELDYAVSLYYIQTDETMENIIYWEKLTGVFPLKCPDSFFAWDKGNPGKNMEYSIEFAYSMRSVLKTPDLLELDRLYQKTASNTDDTTYVLYPDFVADMYNNPYIAKMAAYFGDKRMSGIDDYGRVKYSSNKPSLVPDTDDFNNFANSLIQGVDDITRYYYEPFNDGMGRQAWFLPNYLPQLQSHGIAYVKGPYVVPHPDYNGGKFLLKWV